MRLHLINIGLLYRDALEGRLDCISKQILTMMQLLSFFLFFVDSSTVEHPCHTVKYFLFKYLKLTTKTYRNQLNILKATVNTEEIFGLYS